MSLLDALLLGILEGLTEFLPVSSTGHLILLGQLLGHESEADKAFDIVIQLGAVLAVVVYYRAKLLGLLRGVLAGDPKARRLTIAVAVAFLPAAVVGLAVHHWITDHLFGPIPVGGALLLGGVLMIVVERVRSKAADREMKPDAELDAITLRQALTIGLAQCASLWPGASRSMSTIVGGQLSGLSTAAAAEFSFLLAIPTLGAATVYSLLKNGKKLLDAPSGGTALGVGLLTSFVVALVVITAFLRFLKRWGLAPFGVYRIVVGGVVLALVLLRRHP